MSKSFFVTGTDTDCGKTLMASGLLAAAKQQGLSTAGIKPVAAGCLETPDGLRNDDALVLQQYTTLLLSYEQINPVAFLPAIAPHIAAAEEGRRMTADRLAGFCRGVLTKRPDVTIIEDAGGWRVPLNDRETLADLARQLQLPVIMVVGMKLGCINHALLTAEAIFRDGLQMAGWIANTIDEDMVHYRQNVEAIQRRLSCPLLGEVPKLTDPGADQVLQYLDLGELLA